MFGVRVHILLFIYLFYLIFCAGSTNPRRVFCADSACSVPISEAQGKILYTASEKNVLSFKRGTKVVILGKSKEKNGYWVGQIGNYVGFVPSSHLKEVAVWKTSEMLTHEVPLSIENYKISINEHENNNLGQEKVGTNPLPDTNSQTLHFVRNASGGSPLSNLIHGDISTTSSESLQEHVKNEPQKPNFKGPDSNVEPSISNADNVETMLPLNVNNENSGNVNSDNEQEPGEILNFVETSSDDDSLKYVFNTANDGENLSGESGYLVGEDLSLPKKSSTPDQLDLQKGDAIAGSSSNTERKVDSEEESITLAEEAEASDEKLSNVQNVNERLGENLRGNVVGSMHINNSAKDLKEMSTSSSSNLIAGNDSDNVSISSPNSSSSSDDSISNSSSISSNSVKNNDDDNQISSSSSNSNNLQHSGITNENSLNEKSIDYTLASEVYEATVLPLEYNLSEFNISENEKENINLLQSILPNVNTPSEVNTAQNNILSSPNQNGNELTLENTKSLNERTDNTVNANRNTPESSSNDGIVTNEGSSSVSNSISSSFSSASNVAPSNIDMNYDKTTKDNAEFFDVMVVESPKENTAAYSNPEEFLKETHNPDSVDGISAWAAQFGHTPATEIAKKNMDSLPTNQEIFNAQISEGQPDVFTIETSSTEQLVQSTTPNILAPTPTISSQGDATEKFQAFVPADGSLEKFNNEHPVQEHTSSVDGVIESIEENIAEGSVTEPSVPTTDYAVDPTEESPLGNDFQADNTEGSGFFSKLSNSVLSWIGLADKTEDDETEIKTDEEVISDELIKDHSTEKLSQESGASLEGSCKSGYDLDVNCESTPMEESKTGSWNIWMESKNLHFSSSYKTLMYLVVTAVTVLLFTLGYYFIEKFQSDGPLIAKVNKLEQELLVSSKECLILKDELSNTKEKLNLFETSSNDKIIAALQLELEESKKVRSVLENNVEVLQQELDAATEAGLDLNRMLSEVLTQSGGSESLMKSVEHLQSQLNNQQKIIDEMTTKLIDKTKENQELQDELSSASEKIDGLESEIEDMRGNLNVHLKDNEDVIKGLTSKNSELQLKIIRLNETKEKEVLKLKNLIVVLEKKVKSVSDSLKIKVEECNNLKDSVKKIKMKDNKNIDSLFDASRIKAELAQSTSENTSLKERLKVEEDKLVKLGDNVKILEEEVQKLKLKSEEAQKEKLEAQTRLEVLSNYFKEKETQLQKELGLKEAMWVQKQGDDSTIYERIKSLEEEISSYKSQNDTLKKEILDQERSLKAQIAGLEKKAHDNWIAARQAERKLEESKQEGAQLRNKLTLLEKNMSNDLDTSQHHRVGDEVNGGDSLSPLIHDTSSPLLFPPPLPLDPNNTALMPPGFIPPPLFMPPPPNNFMPPPPPFLPGDHRPPPLGRMSSPPLNNRFSPPPPPEYAYDRMSTPPMSPSSRNYRSHNESDRERFRHRTPTSPSFRSRNWQESPTTGMSGFRPITSERDTRREHKGGSNLSSGHSSDSLDKSSRHSGRV